MRLLLIPFLYATSLFAIVDIASVDFGDKENGFSGSAYGSFQKTRGNTNKDEAEYGGRIQYDTNKTITWLQGSAENDKANGQTNADNAFLHLRHIRQLYTPSWAMEFYTQYRSDKFKNLQSRTVVGTGPRYKISDSKTYGKLFAGLSIMDERIEYTEHTIDPEEHNYRASSYLSYNVNIENNLEFSYLGYYQPKIDHASDYLISSMAELTIHLTKVFDLSYLLEFDYDSMPAHDVERRDTRQKLSFVYRFGENDPLSTYADNIIHSIDQNVYSQNYSIEATAENNTSKDEGYSKAGIEGTWVYGSEVFSLMDDGNGSYQKEDGVYVEKLKWEQVFAQTEQDNDKGARFISIFFQDEEGRQGRVENYLWSGNTLVGLSGDTVRSFTR